LARNDQIVRILTVARALSQSRRGVSLKALAARHGWSWRTVYRDVDALERAGFPVEKENGRYRLIDGWNVPRCPESNPTKFWRCTPCEHWPRAGGRLPLDVRWIAFG